MGQVGGCWVNTGLWSDSHTWRRAQRTMSPGYLACCPPGPLTQGVTHKSVIPHDIPCGRASRLPPGQSWLGHTL